MIFSSSNFTIDQKSPDGNKNRASRRSLQNQTVGIKAWVPTTKYHTIQQTPGIGALFHSSEEPSGTTHSSQIKKDWPQEGLHLRTRGILDQPPYRQAPTPQPADRPHRRKTRPPPTTDPPMRCSPPPRTPNMSRREGGVQMTHWPPPRMTTPP
jgi:hypothetical protein